METSDQDLEMPVGAIWEGNPWKLRLGYQHSDRWISLCPHAVDTGEREQGEGNSRHESYPIYRWPAVIEGWNEGGYNTVGLCLHCIREATKEIP